jgi:hypothetical protein
LKISIIKYRENKVFGKTKTLSKIFCLSVRKADCSCPNYREQLKELQLLENTLAEHMQKLLQIRRETLL